MVTGLFSPGLPFRSVRKPLRIHSQADEGHPLGGDAERPRHPQAVVLGDSDEMISARGRGPHETERAFPVLRGQPGQEEVLTRKGDHHRSPGRRRERCGETEEQRVREHHHVGPGVPDGLGERRNRASGRPQSPLKGGHGQRPELLRVGGRREPLGEAEQRRGIDKPVQSPHASKERCGVLQEDRDPRRNGSAPRRRSLRPCGSAGKEARGALRGRARRAPGPARCRGCNSRRACLPRPR